MKIAFNPSTVAALTAPPNNKDITFDLRGQNIFARGVKFCGTDTWRDIKINNVSIGSNILNLRNGSNTTLTNTNGVVTINSTWRPVVDNLTSDSTTSSLSANLGRVLKALIDGKSNSGHNHDDRYLKLTGGTMTGNIILSPNTRIIKPLASTSNYDSIVRWSVDGETKQYGREIGLHNTGGDSTGSIAIVPYKTDTAPWSGTVGLFIAKNTLKLDGKPIALKSDIPSSLKNPYSLTLLANGTTLATYDGSVSKIVNLTYDNVGAAAKNHTHNSLEPWASYSYITGDSHATALKSIFDKNKTSIPRNKFISMLSRAYDNTSYYMGYFIKNYDNNPYGGFFVAHYDTAYYIGISNGSFSQHRLVYSTDIPNSLKNPYALTISLNGTSQGPYDGSAAKNINITPSSIGAATSEHNHDNRYLKLTGGTMQLGEGLKFHADDNYFGTNSDARIISLLDGNDKVCDGGLIIDERATYNGTEYVTELLRIRDSEFKWKGSNILHSGNSNINGNTITINGSSLTVSKSDHTHNIYAANENYGGFKKSGRLPISGFYQSNESESGGNAPWSNWVHLINCLHNNTSNNFALLIAASFFDNNTFKIRVTNNSVNNTWRNIIHSGNISSLLVKGAYMTPLTLDIATLISSGYLASDYTTRNDTVEYMKAAAKYLLKNYPGYSVFGTMTPNVYGFFTANIYKLGFNSNGNPEHITIHYYPHGGNIINCGTTYGNWYYNTINRDGSSYKLQTARKIWGQSFDGTADISGTLSGVANILFSADNTYNIGSNSAASKYIYTYWLGAKSGLKLELGANNSSFGLGLCIDTNLNVGIGTNSPSYKLDVRGDIRATGQIIREASGYTWVNGRKGALLRETTSTGYHTLWSLKTTNGSWDFGEYKSSGWNNIPVLSYITDTDFNSGNNNATYQIRFPLDSGTIALTKNIPTSLPANGGNADTVDGYHASSLFRDLGWWGSSETHNANDIEGNASVFAYGTHSNVPTTGVLTTFRGSSDGYRWQMAKSYSNRTLYIRQRNGDNGIWSNWLRLLDESDLTWSNIAGKPSSFTPSAHSHSWDSITGKPSSFTPSAHNHDGRYLRLDGSDTMTGQIKSNYSAGSWINGCTHAIIVATYKGYNSLIAAPIKSGNVCISAWNAEDNLNFGYAKTGKTDNNLDKRMYWDAPNNNLHADYFTGHLSGTADNADKLDGIHANGLLTELSNSNKGISITVGGTTKSVSNISVNYASSAGNADTLDGLDSTKFLRQVVVPNNTENDFNTFSNMTLTGRVDPTTGASLKNAPWSGSGPGGGYGVLTYLFNGSGYGTQMAWEYGSNRIYIRNRHWGGSGVGLAWKTSWDKLALTTDIPSSLKNPYALTLKANGTTLAIYDGSSAKEANFTYANVGAASASHTHTYIVAEDLRSKYPGQILDPRRMKLSFLSASTLGIKNDGSYYDVITVRSYADSSGGSDNALLFSKNSNSLYHTRFAFGSTSSWGSPLLIIDSGNIGSQSVAYASKAGSVAWDSITGKPSSFTPSAHTHSWTSITDKIVAGNEFNIVNAGFNSTLWFNYRPINDASKTATISGYHFGNGATGYTSIKALGFIKNGSSSSYVLLGDGGHKTISSLSVNYASSTGNADTLDGTHLNGIFTAFGNNAHNITATIGGVTKSFLVNWAADSDKLDGYHADKYLMVLTIIDATSLNSDTYYPVTIWLPCKNTRIEVEVSLDSGTKPSWSTHQNGFTSRKVWESNGAGWGTTSVERNIFVSTYSYALEDPIRGIGQLTNSSVEFVYVRGGGKYYFRVSVGGGTPTLRKENYTINSQSVAPTKTAPDLIVPCINTPHRKVTLWGQSFNGTNNVSGSLSNTGTITASAAATYDIGSNALDYRYGYFLWIGAKSNTNLRLAANNSDNQIVLHTNGNVGIGTNAPAYKLHVNGTFRATNSTVSDLFVNTGDATLKIYTGRTTDALNDGNICFLTSIDATDGQSHAYPTLYLSRCNIVLLPRGGLVYIGTNPSTGNTTYKLYVNSKIFSNGGFVKNGSSDSYVLLGGGGHKLISDFATSNHTHSNYVTALDTNGNYLTWTKNGSTNNITVPYATTSSYLTSGFSATWVGKWDCNAPDRVVYSDYGSSGRLITNAPSGWNYGTLLELGHTNHNGLNGNLNILLMWDVAHNTTLPGTLWFRGKDSVNGWAKSWAKVITDLNISSILSNYYTASEVNNLLSKKLNTSDFNWTNLPGKLVGGNEFNIVNAGFNGDIWFNHLPINDRSKIATINSYYFGNGHQGLASVKASGFIKSGSSSSYVLLGDGGHQTISSLSVNHALFADYIRKNALPTPANNTVKAYKDSLVKFFKNYPNGIGANVSVSTSIISHWLDDAATYFDSSSYSVIKISGSYDGVTYGQFLLSSYNLTKVGIVGRNSNQWSKIKWLAYEDQIPTDNKLLANGAGYITSNGSCAYATNAGSVAWSNVTGKPSSLKNPYSLNVFGVTYDGSAAKTVTTSTFISLVTEGTSTVTDGTMFITSWASDSGFADTNAVNVPYKRKASCLWSYIDSKVSSKYLPLAGGTMNGNARIGHGSGNLYIGNSGNDGWVYTQDIASLKGTDKWAIRESGAAHFGAINIASKTDNSFNSNVIECNSTICFNYFSSLNVSLCNGGGTVQIGSYTTGDTGNNKLYVNGSEFINGASNVRDHVFANGFRHRSHNSNDSVLLAGGGYSQGVPVRYWAIYLIYIGVSPNDTSYTKRSGNHNFITSYNWLSEGLVTLEINFPSGYSKYNTLIFGNGDHQISHNWATPVYVTIITDGIFGSASQIRVLLSNDSSLDTGYANIYFMCMG